MRRFVVLAVTVAGAIAVSATALAHGAGDAASVRDQAVTPRTGDAHGAASQQASPWLPDQLVDYAPSGVPDFSQCRPEWSRPGSPGSPGQWTHAGPVALADALWYLDSASEPDPHSPPRPNDGHPLVTAYPRFGPTLDDHDIENLAPLIEDLAVRSHTNGASGGDATRGTRWEDLEEAARDYVTARGLDLAYRIDPRWEPDGRWLAAVAGRGGTAVLLLGVWEHQDGHWKRIGGHYAALAGAQDAEAATQSAADGAARTTETERPRRVTDASPTWLALSDPLADTAAFGGDGRAMPDDRSSHGCRDAPRAHDDAAAVSHDRYELYPVPGLPGDRLGLLGYFTPETAGDAAAFHGQNQAEKLAEHAASWRRGTVVMALDAALAIEPLDQETPATSTADPTAAGPGATATGSGAATSTQPVGPTAPAQGSPTAPAPVVPSATSTDAPTATSTEAPTATVAVPDAAIPRAYLPWLRR